MIVSLGLEDLAVVVSELEAARRHRLEQADASDDAGVAGDYRGAADRYARIIDGLTSAAYRWHVLDEADRAAPQPQMTEVRVGETSDVSARR